MNSTNRYTLGLFVSSGVVLLIVILFLIGLMDEFKPKLKIVTFFKESVQGLEEGAAVKFRGVTIGKVTRLSVTGKESLIKVDMEIDIGRIRTLKESALTDDAENKFLENVNNMVQKGLRCRLGLLGITGMRYIEVDYFKPNEVLKDEHIILDENVAYIPSTPSLLTGLQTNLTVTLAKISNIKFEQISADISSNLKELKRLLKNPEIPIIVNEFTETSKNLKEISKTLKVSITKERIDDLVKEVKDNMDDIKHLTAKANKAIDDAELQKCSAAWQKTLQDISDWKKEFGVTLRDISDAKEDVSVVLSKLGNVVESLNELINNLANDPSSIIRGKHDKKIELE
jgi:ABC-type transporter Mla subunit MlaD